MEAPRPKPADCEVFLLGEREAYGVTWLIDGRTGNPGKLVEDPGFHVGDNAQLEDDRAVGPSPRFLDVRLTR